MLFVCTGAAGFLLCFVYDLFSLRGRRGGNVFFALGGLMLAGSTLALLLPGLPGAFQERPLWSCVYSCCALAGLGLLIHALFFALPAKDAYASNKKTETVSTGVYALCRHPGLWFFAFVYLFLALLARRPVMTAAAITFTALDAVYVILQDRLIFPKTLKGYKAYQKAVPFILPRLWK